MSDARRSPSQARAGRSSSLLRTVFAALGLMLVANHPSARSADVPTPTELLGFRPGDDFRLAKWAAVVDSFRKIDAASDRVVVEELGLTTEGRPYVVAIVSSPDTVRNRESYRQLQRRVADPRLAAEGGLDPVRASKPVVLITCSIHSNETASTLMAVDLLHELATKDDPATREILENVILLLVPSANPDGVDIVADWYERSKGHPWEGEGLPKLYHPYAGHDTNRDWFMLNLAETRLLTKLLYRDWFPTITYDVHQMGSRGARLFVPPFFDPINPNLDPRVSQGIFLIGAHMAADLASAGKRGVLTNAMYDNWWNGGNRTVPQRHNMVGVLTEAASVKMASPIFLNPNDLAGVTRGFRNHAPAVNFVDPWAGGWWRLRDIVDYELIASRSLLRLAARYRDQFQSNYRAMAADAIERGRSEPPFAWVVPLEQRDPGSAATMVDTLRQTGIEVRRARKPFQAGGSTYPAGSYILPASQPYRAHLKDMMERQAYPDRFGVDGAAEPPYDVAGWTLPLQMGVKASTVANPFEMDADSLEVVPRHPGDVPGPEFAASYLIEDQTNDAFRLINYLIESGFKPSRVVKARDPSHVGKIALPATREVRDTLIETSPHMLVRISSKTDKFGEDETLVELRRHRLGLYQPWVPSMDEGWTRLVLERFGFPYTTIHNAEIRSGRLRERFEVILLPSVDPGTIRAGYAKEASSPEFVGGLGAEGAEALRTFVSEGGVIVALEDSSTYLIEEFALPIVNPLRGLKTSEFYGPGSIVGASISTLGRGGASIPRSSILAGVPDTLSVYFDRSLAFVPKSTTNDVSFPLLYTASRPLESGWLLGPEKLQGQGAIAEARVGAGRLVLFGFPPQHRGQTHGSFRLLFNAISGN